MQIKYSENYGKERSDKDRADRFEDYLKRFFNVEIADKNGLKDLRASIGNEKNGQFISFSKSTIEIIHEGETYSNFTDSIIPLLFKLKSFFDNVVSLEKFEELELNKINIFALSTEEGEEFSKENARTFILSQDLIKNLSDKNLTHSEKNIQDFLKFNFNEKILKTDDRINFTIRNTFIPPNEDEPYHHLVLDEIVVLNNKNKISFDSLIEKFREINKKLYDCYHWSVTTDVIDMMNCENNSEDENE